MLSAVDAEYAQSYGKLEVHELMLRDEARTMAYARYIAGNQEMFANRIVVDVGAGTGILSLFAARAGARQVFAIEASEVTSEICSQIVAHNGLSDRITVLRGRVEDISLPEGIKADILISEWMGFYLLHESMLASVLVARDRFLSPSGVIVPSAASLFVCPVSMKQHHEKNVKFWDNLYGFNFSTFAQAMRHVRSTQPCITTFPVSECLAEPQLVVRLELAFLDVTEIRHISGSPSFTIAKNDVLRGFACWFDVEFDGAHPSVLSTSPGAPDTHWCQTVLMLPDALLVSTGDQIACNLMLSQDGENPRRYNITVEIPDDGEDEEEGVGQDVDLMNGEEENMERDVGELNEAAQLEMVIRSVMSKPS